MTNRREILKRLLKAAAVPVIAAPGMEVATNESAKEVNRLLSAIDNNDNWLVDIPDLRGLDVRLNGKTIHITKKDLDLLLYYWNPELGNLDEESMLRKRGPIRTSQHMNYGDRAYPGKTIEVKPEK